MKRLSIFLVTIVILGLAKNGFCQVTFQPDGCDFRVWFFADPAITKTSVQTEYDELIEGTIGESEVIMLGDDYAHYFRAECSNFILPEVEDSLLKTAIVGDLLSLAEMNHLKEPKAWAEVMSNGLMVGRLRASINTGKRTYFFDIRRYFGKENMFDVWAGAEIFPTEHIAMFHKSVAYEGRFLHLN